MSYFVLSGGFWYKSKNSDISPRQVDPKTGGMTKSMDYVIKIEGLPESLLQPEGKTETLTYWCTQCNKPVPQNHVEMNYGCALNHKVETRAIIEENWRMGVFEKYELKKAPWIKGYRIWFENPNGEEIWRKIFAIIDNNCRSKGQATPLAVRISPDGHTIALPEEIPTIKLDIKEEKKEEVRKEEYVEKSTIKEKKIKNIKIFSCNKCSFTSRGYLGYYNHMIKQHGVNPKEQKNVYINDSNTNTTSPLENISSKG